VWKKLILHFVLFWLVCATLCPVQGWMVTVMEKESWIKGQEKNYDDIFSSLMPGVLFTCLC
jgi:TM2 domain-containing membrane protein YozV